MVKFTTAILSKFNRFKRIKLNDTRELYSTHGRRSKVCGGLTQFGFGVSSFGTLVHISDTTAPISLNVFTYDEDSYTEKNYTNVEHIPIVASPTMTWIDVDGIHDQEIISQIGQRYDIHSLVQSDITTADQRTKLDVCDDALFLVCRLIYHDLYCTGKTIVQQISFYLKDDVLITFQESSKDLFDQIKNRIRQGKGRTRKCKVDYLFYSLIDVIVDHYMDVLDVLGVKVENIDDELMKNLRRDTLETIYDMKRDMLSLRSVIYPLKEIIIKLQKDEETGIMQESTNIYLKDLFDHVVQVNDSIDTYREMLASYVDLYMMLNSNGMNEIVKILTIISTIFIPLTFITGLYGMENFVESTYEETEITCYIIFWH
ncbi:unnamed protein product [Rotaria socialis]|uniref:Magnesium transport protein CorA n=1 Tax=Rotaria socialis TaxID=392032 RepID=A0A820QSA0_9BILA|nr:unnamed protein product [Rotaria socialis]